MRLLGIDAVCQYWDLEMVASKRDKEMERFILMCFCQKQKTSKKRRRKFDIEFLQQASAWSACGAKTLKKHFTEHI